MIFFRIQATLVVIVLVCGVNEGKSKFELHETSSEGKVNTVKIPAKPLGAWKRDPQLDAQQHMKLKRLQKSARKKIYGNVDGRQKKEADRVPDLKRKNGNIVRRQYDLPTRAYRILRLENTPLPSTPPIHKHGLHHRKKNITKRHPRMRAHSKHSADLPQSAPESYMNQIKGMTQRKTVEENNVLPPNLRDGEGDHVHVPQEKEDQPKSARNEKGKYAQDLNDKNKIRNLTPYSLLRDLKDFIIPKFPEMNITTEILGRTVEYNDIIMLKCMNSEAEPSFRTNDQNKYDDSVPIKKIILIVHGLSTSGFNELPCLSTAKGLKTLLSFYFKHAAQFDFYIIPMANPDGVSEKEKKFWNKNMSPQSACPGVALDRNFEVAWNNSLGEGTSCNQQYPGKAPFSEYETQAIRNVFHKYSSRLYGYIHVHGGSFTPDVFRGDAILYPKGFSDSTSDDDRYIDLRAEVEETMKNMSFKVYSFGVETIHNWHGGRIFGTSVDFAASVYGLPFAMEFVMQLYEDDLFLDRTEERETYLVLHEVWKRVIDVTFSFMHKTLHHYDQ